MNGSAFVSGKSLTVIFLALLLSFGVRAEQVKLNLEAGQRILPAAQVQKSYIKIGLAGFAIPSVQERPPINVALVLDRSGSMSGQKLAQAKEAAILALDYLRRDDSLSVVIYDHRVEVLVRAAPFRDRMAVENAIRNIRAEGRTALYDGVRQGADELRRYLSETRVNRVVLLSDGLANVGPSTPDELGQLGRRLGGEGVSVTTIGLGLGYNEDLMVRLADASDGNHVFAETPAELAEVFRNEFGELTSVVAGDVIISIQCRNGVRPLRALGREAEIEGNLVKARLNQLYAKQEKYLLLEVETPAGQDGTELDLADVEVTYSNLVSKENDRIKAGVRIAYSSAPEKVEQSVNKAVMVSAAEQIGANMDEKALQLKDRGDAKGAGDVLRQKAEYLEDQAKRYESERLLEQSKRSREVGQALAAPAASESWSKMRKEIRADQYGIKKQQSYK
ncbi:MAG: VWA domain-containing protein [Gammaproteobacteria bacterium]|nr:VWA domain-containing protein [Gammaproteobacteria bacterium]MBU1654181.1 VWA domain-containing protein [Gammaproteobacteria bacterium]MBU1961817.1 VWA domain-containing protein [Gammaproteobacteria bacterium]